MVRVLVRSVLLFIFFVTAGCATPPIAGERPVEWSSTKIVEHDESGTYLDVLCTFGGGDKIARVAGSTIASPTTDLEVNTTLSGNITGLQIGWSLDDGSVNWLPLVSVPGASQRIHVDPAAWEVPKQERWKFFFQMNANATQDQCFTGGGNGGFSVLIRSLDR